MLQSKMTVLLLNHNHNAKNKTWSIRTRKHNLKTIALSCTSTFTVLKKCIAENSMLLNFLGFQFVKNQSNCRKLEDEGN